MTSTEKIHSFNLNQLLRDSRKLEGAFGAISWSVLEMFRRGGMPETEVKKIYEHMKNYFAKPTNTECNAILQIVEQRLIEDKERDGVWYE